MSLKELDLVREGKGIIDDTGQACFRVDLALIDGSAAGLGGDFR